MKDASLFLDKAILIFSSVLLWFLFFQLNEFFNLKLEIINLHYLYISMIFNWFTIFLILISCILTISQAKICVMILDKQIDFDKWRCKFNNYVLFINSLRIIYFITFLIAVLFPVLFYISNFENYVF
jgi:hypothetical protein